MLYLLFILFSVCAYAGPGELDCDGTSTEHSLLRKRLHTPEGDEVKAVSSVGVESVQQTESRPNVFVYALKNYFDNPNPAIDLAIDISNLLLCGAFLCYAAFYYCYS